MAISVKNLVIESSWYTVKIAVIFAAYYFTARIGLSLDAVGGFATLFWPPSGIALAALLIFGYRYWPGIALAAFFANYINGAPFLVAISIAFGNTFEALLGTYLVKNFVDFKNSMQRVRDVLGLVFLAGVLSTMIAASVGSSSLLLSGIISQVEYDDTWLAWWVGDMLGIIAIAPLILVWSRKPRTFSPRRLTGAILLAILLVSASILVFGSDWWVSNLFIPFSYVVYPILIWIALTYRQRGSVTGTFLVMIIAIWYTSRGKGPFYHEDLNRSLLHLQSFIAVTAVTFMTMAATVAQLRRYQSELRFSEVRFRNIADAAPVIIWENNSNGEITYLSRQWQKFTGQRKQEALGMGWLTAVSPKFRKILRQTATQAVTNKTSIYVRYRIKNKQGHYRWVLALGVPRFDTDGNFDGHIGTITDIEDALRGRESEEKARLLARQKSELLILNKAKDEFIAIASHQLRTPATGVKQYVGMLLEGFTGALTPQQTMYLERAYESNERQLKIINDLLSVARVDAEGEPIKKEPADIVPIILDSIRSSSPVLSIRNQSINFKNPHGNHTANIDKDKIKMVLENLIDNASKYSFNDTVIFIKLTTNKNKLNISVTDQGVGILKKDLPKLFKKFSRLDNPLSVPVGGTGLGLYWVKKIIDLHGGSISVDSKPNHGSTFSLTIPKI